MATAEWRSLVGVLYQCDERSFMDTALGESCHAIVSLRRRSLEHILATITRAKEQVKEGWRSRNKE